MELYSLENAFGIYITSQSSPPLCEEVADEEKSSLDHRSDNRDSERMLQDTWTLLQDQKVMRGGAVSEECPPKASGPNLENL